MASWKLIRGFQYIAEGDCFWQIVGMDNKLRLVKSDKCLAWEIEWYQ